MSEPSINGMTQSIWIKPCLTATFFTTNVPWHGVGSNYGLGGEGRQLSAYAMAEPGRHRMQFILPHTICICSTFLTQRSAPLVVFTERTDRPGIPVGVLRIILICSSVYK
jgi:hypothetical protein